jgi:hypothetical protein
MRFVRTEYADGPHLTTPEFVYSLFGLQVHCNIALPEISSIQLENPGFRNEVSINHCVQIRLGATPEASALPASALEQLSYSSEYKDESGNPALKIWNSGGLLRLEYFDETQFWLDLEGTRVWATWPHNLTVEDTATYLLGPVLGLLLRLRGVTCLHASAVSLGDSVVAFVGAEGAGKSTTAAALAKLGGFAIVSDDVVALAETDGSFYVHPAYPYLCLWPESVESLYGSREALPRFSRDYEKRCLSLDRRALQFETRSLPLKAIYILGERRSELAPIIEAISPRQSILELLANTFATNVLDSAMRAKEFETLGRLIPRVPVRRVIAHTEASRLPDLCRLIRENLERLNAHDSPAPEEAVADESFDAP